MGISFHVHTIASFWLSFQSGHFSLRLIAPKLHTVQVLAVEIVRSHKNCILMFSIVLFFHQWNVLCMFLMDNIIDRSTKS